MKIKEETAEKRKIAANQSADLNYRERERTSTQPIRKFESQKAARDTRKILRPSVLFFTDFPRLLYVCNSSVAADLIIVAIFFRSTCARIYVAIPLRLTEHLTFANNTSRALYFIWTRNAMHANNMCDFMARRFLEFRQTFGGTRKPVRRVLFIFHRTRANARYRRIYLFIENGKKTLNDGGKRKPFILYNIIFFHVVYAIVFQSRRPL